MRPIAPSRAAVVTLAVVFAAAVAASWLAGWVDMERLPELAALMLAGMLTACVPAQAGALTDRSIMAPSFVAVFAALMLMGPQVAGRVALAARVAGGAMA